MVSQNVRGDIERLAGMVRGSATAGEADAARLLVEMLGERGIAARLEQERAVAGFWLPTGLAAGAGALAGLVGARSRAVGALLAAGGAALMADDVDCGRHLLRRALPKKVTTNVLARVGDQDAEETIVVLAHHDAPHTGLLFHPGLVPLVNRVAPRWYAKQKTSVQTGRLLVTGPALTALGCALGIAPLRRFGVLWSAVSAALLADVARSPVIDGANDNLSAVAVMLSLAEAPEVRDACGVRVLLLSTGSEETFMEGMRGFLARHRDRLDPATTRFVALECVGSPYLALIEGEGMLRMRDYDSSLRDELQGAADEAGIELWRGLRLGAGATDALPALRAGYATACLASVTELKTPANYHWKTDTVENLCWETIGQTTRVVAGLVRRAGSRRFAPSVQQGA